MIYKNFSLYFKSVEKQKTIFVLKIQSEEQLLPTVLQGLENFQWIVKYVQTAVYDVELLIYLLSAERKRSGALPTVTVMTNRQ